MHRIVIEGIVLRVTPFGEKGQIASLFTRQEGKLQTITDLHSAQKRQEWLTPLLRIESELFATRTGLYRTHTYSLLESFAPLRTEYALLQRGCLLLQAIDLSQAGQKSAPKLYELLNFYLSKLHALKDSQVGVSSFYLKLLRHEGLFTIDAFACCSDEEKMIIEFLAYVLEWEALIPLILPSTLHDAIVNVFKGHFC